MNSSRSPTRTPQDKHVYYYPLREGEPNVQEAKTVHFHVVQTCNYDASHRASQTALGVKNLPAKAGDAKTSDLTPGLGRSSEIGVGNPLQYPCLGNPMDGGAWRATGHGVAKSGM